MESQPQHGRGRRPSARLLALPLSAFLLGGCALFLIDSEARSAEFCERNTELLEMGRFDEPGTRYNEAQSTFYSEEYSKSMRYAEDGTRELRRKARNLEDAYDDVRDMVHADDVPAEEATEKYQRLRDRRAEVREVCTQFPAEASDDDADEDDVVEDDVVEDEAPEGDDDAGNGEEDDATDDEGDEA